jgi:hypothetical protein
MTTALDRAAQANPELYAQEEEQSQPAQGYDFEDGVDDLSADLDKKDEEMQPADI